MTKHPLSEQRKLQDVYGVKKQPTPELQQAIFIQENGDELFVDILGTDEDEQLALLSCEEGGQRQIWIAQYNNTGVSGTWHWTQEQLAARKKADFRGDKKADTPIQIAPIHKNRRVELLMLGLQLNKTDEEVQDQLKAEGLDPTLPTNYRTEQGELDLLKHWRR